MPTLLELSDDMRALGELLQEEDMTDESAARILDGWWAETSADLNEKIDGYMYLIAEKEAMAEWRSGEAARLELLAKTDANLARRLRERLKVWIELNTQKGKYETRRSRLWSQRNGGTPVILHVAAHELPVAFREDVIVYKARMDKIKEVLKSGQALTFAHLGERGTHLRWK